MSETTTQMNGMTPELAGAVCEAMGKIETLKKGETNEFDNYKFASIDDFLKMLNPICAGCGLFVLMNEESCDMVTGKNNKPWLSITFRFLLCHKSGAECDGGRRTVMVPANGAQAFGSAQSYALKQWWRALLQISTGDKDDADYEKSDELPPGRKTATRNVSAQQARQEVDWPKVEKSIRECDTERKLLNISARIDEHEERGSWPTSYIGSARELIEIRLGELEKLHADDAVDEEQAP